MSAKKTEDLKPVVETTYDINLDKLDWGVIYWNLVKGFDIDISEYVFLESVYRLSRSPDFDFWCYQSKQNLADRYGTTKQTIHRIMNRLSTRGLLERGGEGNRGLRPCKQFVEYFEKATFKRLNQNTQLAVDTKRANIVAERYPIESKVDTKSDHLVTNSSSLVTKSYHPDTENGNNVLPSEEQNVTTTVTKCDHQGNEMLPNINPNINKNINRNIEKEMGEIFDGRRESPRRGFHYGSVEAVIKFIDKLKDGKMALLTQAIKNSEFFNKRTSYLLMLWMKERFKVTNNYAIRDEKRLEHLKLFYDFEKRYSYRVLSLAIHNYFKNSADDAKKFGGVIKDFVLEREAEDAKRHCLSMCDNFTPQVYNPDKREFVAITQRWDGHKYMDKIKEYGLHVGDLVREDKKKDESAED